MPHVPGHVLSAEEKADIRRRAMDRLRELEPADAAPAPPPIPAIEQPAVQQPRVEQPAVSRPSGQPTSPLGFEEIQARGRAGAFGTFADIFDSLTSFGAGAIVEIANTTDPRIRAATLPQPFSKFLDFIQEGTPSSFLQALDEQRLPGAGSIQRLPFVSNATAFEQTRDEFPFAQRLGLEVAGDPLNIPIARGISAGGSAISRAVRPAAGVAEDVVQTAARNIPAQVARRPTVAEAQQVIPGIRTTRQTIPDDAVAITPPTQSGNLFDFRPIQAGLSKAQELKNIARRTVTRITRRGIQPIEENPLVSGAFSERARVTPIIESQANRISRGSEERIRRVFNLDDNGRITELDGVDPSIRGAPTIQDVAARLPTYSDAIGSNRLQVMRALEADVSQVKAVYDEVGIDISKRFDIEEGGFYLPRGSADTGDFDLPIVKTSRRGGKPGADKPAVFSSQAEGINQGFEYPSFGETLNRYVREAGNRARNRHVSDFFAKATDENGELLGETAKQRVFRQNPDLVREFRGIQHDIARLKNLGFRMSGRLNARVDDLINNPITDDPEVLDSLISALDVRAARGPSAGQNLSEIRDSVRVMKGKLQKLRPAYKNALERARTSGREQASIDLPGLEGRAFPLELSNAANKILRDEGQVRGRGAGLIRGAEALRDLYRGLNATLDNSAPGIQGLLGMVTKPRAFTSAMKTNAKVWFSRDADRVLGAHIVDFDEKAVQEGLASSDVWVRNGLRIGAGQTEFELGRGALSAIEKIPGVRRANQAFGFFGDAMRLDWAQNELQTLVSKGRSVDEIVASGDLRNIAKTVNRATGWTPGKAGGDIGDWVFFAPRFLQSRLETLASAGLGLRPGATLDQRIARRSMLRLVGYAVMGTVLLNESRGKETDFRPIVNGRFNSNFLRVRDLFGRDWSLLGTWDGIARAIITTALGRPDQALRGLGSGPVSMGWDLISGTSFNGERPLEDPVSFGTWLLRSFTPFAAQEIPEAVGQISAGVQERDPVQVASGGALIVGEAFGAKSAPQSFLDEADSTAREIFQGQRYQDLEPYQKNDVQEVEAVERAGNRRPSYGYFPALDEIDKRQQEKHSSILHLVNSEVISTGEAVQRYFDTKTEARISRNQAAGDFGIQFDDTDPALAETPNERALAEYYQTFDRATFDDVFIPRIWQELLEEVQSRWGPQQQEYVTRNINRRRLSQGIRDLLEDHSPAEFGRQQASEDARNRHRRFVQQNGFQEIPLSAANFTVRGVVDAAQDLIER